MREAMRKRKWHLETGDRRCTPQSCRSLVDSAIEPITCCIRRVQAQPRKPVFVTPEISILLLVRLNSTASKDKVCLTQRLNIATLRYASTIGHRTSMSTARLVFEERVQTHEQPCLFTKLRSREVPVSSRIKLNAEYI
jgi:hypothetical protein